MATRSEVFHFDEFTLDVRERRLLRGTEAVRLSPKAYDVLVALVQQRGHLVTKEELLKRLWPGSFVEEGSLNVYVSALRKALGEDARRPAYIETVARSGYRFIAAVTFDPAEGKPEKSSAPSATARPVELYEHVGRGRSHLLSGSFFELQAAVDAFRSAIEIDPTYAPAHAGLARARCVQATFRVVPYQEAFTEAKASALRALAMDSASADAQVALGTVLFLSEWDWKAAERSLQRALEINPDHTEALLQYGALQEAFGRLDDGLRCKQQALARDPRSPGVLVQIAISYWHQRKYNDTLVWARRALEVDPKHVLAIQCINRVYLKIGDMNKFAAWTVGQVSQAIAWGFPEERVAVMKQVIADMQQVYATAGLSGVNRFWVDQITNPQLDIDVLLKMAFFRAVLYGDAGRLDEAFDYLDQAIALRDPALVHLAVAPEWDSLRHDARFAERLRSMALAAPESVPKNPRPIG
jgi:DNA-binding winged helix-turn-helix (wHTH) protein/cytochrome c-type biogenesis protein CcmH/NrfG